MKNVNVRELFKILMESYELDLEIAQILFIKISKVLYKEEIENKEWF